jgi:branched-chain amino acid transport system substrate-binding protein
VLGRPLELVTYDDQSAAEQAVPIANKLLGEGVKAVISGSYSAPTPAAAGVFQKEGIPYISAYAIHRRVRCQEQQGAKLRLVFEVAERVWN